MSKRPSSERFSRPADEAPQNAAAGAGPVRKSRLVAGALGAVVVVWLVFRVSVANALFDSRSNAAPALAPKHPEAALAAARLGQPGSGLSEAPLAEEPFLLAARRAIQAGDTEGAKALLDEALRRNPRSREGLLLRLDQQLRRNQVSDAAVTIAVLSRLLPDSGPFLIGELARLARDPDVRGALDGVLETDAGMRTELLEALARQGADPDAIFSLAGPVARAAPGATPRWQTIMLDELVSRGQATRARQVWNRLAGLERTPSGVYDAEFAGLPGPQPFNWRFEASPAGFAEPSAGGALFVEFYGREDAVLGEQLLSLPPGEYRISFDAEGDADGEGGRLAWTVTCQANRRALASVPVAGLESSRTFSATFSVPDGCPAQWLRLTGKFGEFPEDQRMTVTNFRIAGARS